MRVIAWDRINVEGYRTSIGEEVKKEDGNEMKWKGSHKGRRAEGQGRGVQCGPAQSSFAIH